MRCAAGLGLSEADAGGDRQECRQLGVVAKALLGEAAGRPEQGAVAVAFAGRCQEPQHAVDRVVWVNRAF
jgi:hypothetical protein